LEKGRWTCATLAAVLLALPVLAGLEASPARLAWYETLGNALGLAAVQPPEITDQARRQRAADALRAAGADPADCDRLKSGQKVSPGFPILEQCAIYNQPGIAQQPVVQWNTRALFLAGLVVPTLLAGGGIVIWLIHKWRALPGVDPCRPGTIPLGNLARSPLPKVRILPSRVRIRLRMPW
jgi:hypothetical protein